MKTSLIALIVSFILSLVVGPLVIRVSTKLKMGQNILSYVDKHATKQGTPTMGGVMFLLALIGAYVIFGAYKYVLASVVFGITLECAILGFLDDYLKVRHKQNEGLKAYQKALGQFGIAIILAFFVYRSTLVGADVVVPFSDKSFSLGIFIIPFVILVFIAVTNAVNLTDGLDGLAGGVSVAYLVSFGVVLGIHIDSLRAQGVSVQYTQELTTVMVITFAFAGAILAYVCFNAYPAKIFMGDTGSLAIGGFVACACSVTKLYLYMPLIGLMFVLSTLSVMIQVIYYKLTKKRVFKMAPLHHHFELSGMHETKVVAIYIVITIMLGVICIAFNM